MYPNDFKALRRRAEARLRLGDAPGAVRDLRAAQRLFPEDAGVRTELADAVAVSLGAAYAAPNDAGGPDASSTGVGGGGASGGDDLRRQRGEEVSRASAAASAEGGAAEAEGPRRCFNCGATNGDLNKQQQQEQQSWDAGASKPMGMKNSAGAGGGAEAVVKLKLCDGCKEVRRRPKLMG